MKILETDKPEIKKLKQLVNYHIIESKSWRISSEYWRKNFFKLSGKEDHRGIPLRNRQDI